MTGNSSFLAETLGWPEKDVGVDWGLFPKAKLTFHGKEHQHCLVHPRIAHMLLFAKQHDQLWIAELMLQQFLKKETHSFRIQGLIWFKELKLCEDFAVEESICPESKKDRKSGIILPARCSKSKLEKLSCWSWQTGCFLGLLPIPKGIAGQLAREIMLSFNWQMGRSLAIGHRDDLPMIWLPSHSPMLEKSWGKSGCSATKFLKIWWPMIKTQGSDLVGIVKKGGLVLWLKSTLFGPLILEVGLWLKVEKRQIATRGNAWRQSEKKWTSSGILMKKRKQLILASRQKS